MRRKAIPEFLLHVAFLVTLCALIPGTREAVPTAVHAVGNAMLGSLSDGRSVRLKPPGAETRRGRADTDMLGRKAGRIEYEWRVTFSSYRRLFWPMATLAALILATPMPRRRLAWALPIPLVALFAFFMLEVAAFASVLNGAKQPVVAGQSSLWRDLVPVSEAMFNSPITNFSAVFLLWAAFAAPTRGLDTDGLQATLRRLLGPGRAGPASTAPPSGEPAADSPASDPSPSGPPRGPEESEPDR
jgi:hypothetical protein